MTGSAALGADAGMLARHGLALADEQSNTTIAIDPTPRFALSPQLYMQFMEPLGTTDGSVEASWDYDSDDWRRDFVATTTELAPDVVRFGGLLSRYYRWREGVGPPLRRPWMRNYVWGGKETNRVGTHELVDFCRRVSAQPLMCVNFLGDGRREYADALEGSRIGDAREAADWVSYANDPDDRTRIEHGHRQPYDILLWQLGNETSYDGGFDKAQSIDATIQFAKAMRERDSRIRLIGWGDSGWAGDLVDQAGEHLELVAIHMMQQLPLREDSVLRGLTYQREPQQAWDELMAMIPACIERKLLGVRAELEARGSRHGIAVTEGHLSLPPRNINPLLTEWLTGVYHARALNLYQRHGDRVRMCTIADFNGTRWTTNALMLGVPDGPCYLLPAGAVMRLFAREHGSHGVQILRAPAGLDIAASRTGDDIYLHVANMNFSGAVSADFSVAGLRVDDGVVLEIAPEDPRQSSGPQQPDAFAPRRRRLRAADARWSFPARSVSVVKLRCRESAVAMR